MTIHSPFKEYLEGVVARRDALPPQSYYDETFRKLPSGEYEANDAWLTDELLDQNMAWAVNYGRIDMLIIYLNAGVSPNSYTLYGESMLSHAVIESQVESARILVQYGADPCLPDLCGGKFPLNHAVSISSSPGRVQYTHSQEIIDMLIINGAKITSFKAFQYICSISTRPMALIDLAIKNGSDLPALRSPFGETVLHETFQYGKSLTAVVLEAVPVLLNMRDLDNCTALHVATDYGTVSAIEYLVQKRGMIDATDVRLETALHIAVKRSLDRVKLLAAHPDVDMNAVNLVAETPLSIAISYHTLSRRYFDIIHFILRDERTHIDQMSVLAMKHLLYPTRKSISFWRSDGELVVRLFWLYAKQSAQLAGLDGVEELLFALMLPIIFNFVHVSLMFWAIAIGTNPLLY
jgi:ankyrin repeat protein